MRISMILACGLALGLLGQVFGQEAIPPSGSAATSGSEVGGLDFSSRDALTFTPTDNDLWFTGEFLFGWINGANLPALVTSSDPVPADKADAGVLGETGTLTLLSGATNRGVVPGFRLGAGYVYDKEYGLGAEVGFTYLASQSSSYFFDSADYLGVLARPFLDATDSDAAAAELVAFPGEATGNISVTSKNGNLYGLNLDLSERIGEDNGYRLEALFGYRFAYFNDALGIRQHSELAPNLAGIDTIDRSDSFSASNAFHGLDLGLRSVYSGNNWSLSLLGKVAPGYMNRTVDIRGRTVTTFASSASTSTPAGLYALSSNSGSHDSGEWTVLPELGANMNWQLRPNLALRLGYSALFLTKIVRADDQIDFSINPALIGAPAGATPAAPTYNPDRSNLWIQTLNIGVDVSF